MSMISLMDFFYMQGKGIYVWPAYGIALLVLVWNIVLPLIKRKKLEQSIEYRIKHGRKTPISQDVK